MKSFLRKSLLAYGAVDVFFTPGVCFCFLSVFDYPPGALRTAVAITLVLGLIKHGILLASVARYARPIDRWVERGAALSHDELAEALRAAYEAPVALGKLWALLWTVLIGALTAFTVWVHARDGLPFERGLPVAIGFLPTVLLGAGALGTILGGAMFAPPAGAISVEAHERHLEVDVRRYSLRALLAFFAFGLCMAPTCWFASFALAILLDGRAATSHDFVLFGLFLLLPVVFALIGAVALGAMFSGSIGGVAEVLRQIAGSGGKLEGIRRVPIYFHNELGDLGARANVMVDRLIHARAQLERAHEAQLRGEKLASIGQFAATVGHELRNPLAAVRNAHEFVERKLQRHPELVAAEPKLMQLLAVATRELDACSRLISDLLEFAREREPVLEPLPLRQVIAEAISLVPVRADVTVENNVPDDLPVPDLDKEQFRRMVINLVQNAVEAFPEARRGVVRVDATYARGTGWRLSIADDGPGIAPDVAARIFEPLFTTKTKGTGLGLAVVKNVARRHGGTVELDTAIGRGTAFHIAWGGDRGGSAVDEHVAVEPRRGHERV